MCVNSTPVTPEPITQRCDGISGGGYASRVVRMRSPSSAAQSGTRGREPVASTNEVGVDLDRSSVSVSAVTSCGPDEPTGPVHQPHALGLEQVVHRLAQLLLDRRHPLAQRVDVELALGARVPSMRARASSASSPPVAIIAFDGMQSQRCAAPPMTSRSIERDLGAERRRDRRRGVARRAATDDHESSATAPKATRRAPVASDGCPSSVTTRSLGRLVIVAADASRRRPFTVAPAPTEPRHRDAGRLPVLSGPRGRDAARDLPDRRRRARARGWRVRVVPNLYPIVGAAEPRRRHRRPRGRHPLPRPRRGLRPARRRPRRPRCSP